MHLITILLKIIADESPSKCSSPERERDQPTLRFIKDPLDGDIFKRSPSPSPVLNPLEALEAVEAAAMGDLPPAVLNSLNNDFVSSQQSPSPTHLSRAASPSKFGE